MEEWRQIAKPAFKNLRQARQQTERIERHFVHNRTDGVYYYRDGSDYYQVFADGDEWIVSHHLYDFGYVLPTRKAAYDFIRGTFTADIEYWHS